MCSIYVAEPPKTTRFIEEVGDLNCHEVNQLNGLETEPKVGLNHVSNESLGLIFNIEPEPSGVEANGENIMGCTEPTRVVSELVPFLSAPRGMGFDLKVRATLVSEKSSDVVWLPKSSLAFTHPIMEEAQIEALLGLDAIGEWVDDTESEGSLGDAYGVLVEENYLPPQDENLLNVVSDEVVSDWYMEEARPSQLFGMERVDDENLKLLYQGLNLNCGENGKPLKKVRVENYAAEVWNNGLR